MPLIDLSPLLGNLGFATSVSALAFSTILPYCGHLGARFGFVLDEELKEAASCDEVKDALAAKISRERIGVEVCALSCILQYL